MARGPEILIGSSQNALRVPRKKISALIEYVAEAENTDLTCVDVAVVGDEEIARLNRQYLRHEGVTDVISFDLTEPEDQGVRGQIVVCADEAVRQARARGHGPQRELLLYVAHGLLHVLGWEDDSQTHAAAMHAREEELLERFLASRRRG